MSEGPGGGAVRWTRRAVQTALFLLFLWLIWETKVPLRTPLPPDFFLRLDPLLFVGASLSAREVLGWPAFLPAVLVLLSAFALGRVFCGWVCPMGTSLDIGERALRIRPKSKGASSLPAVKFYLLALLLFTCLISPQVLYLLDPMPFVTRAFALGFYPIVPIVANPVLLRLDRAPLHTTGFNAGLLFAGLLILLVLLGSFERRFWCRNLCPLGAMLSLPARVAPLRRRVNLDKCTECMRCVRECKTGALGPGPADWRPEECTLCMTCVSVCPEGAVSFGFRGEAGRRGVDIARRRLLLAGLGGVLLSLFLSTSSMRRRGHPRLIRPPNALPEEKFLNACVRCGECMKVCPTSGLQPCLFEGGWEALWTPVLVPSIGPCESNCNACGEVCPTGAIRPFKVGEKPNIKMGTALINRSTCLVWAYGENCFVCVEVCPYKAARKTPKGPVVLREVCVGCGICEFNCPTQPAPSIYVVSWGERRA